MRHYVLGLAAMLLLIGCATGIEMRPQSNINMTGYNITYMSCLRFNDASWQCSRALNQTQINTTIQDYLSVVEYNATTCNTTGGTFTSGMVSNIWLQDDGRYYNVTEGNGANSLIIEVNFTGVIDFDRINTKFQYVGGSSHVISLYMWDTVASSWEIYNQYGTTGSNYIESIIMIDDYLHHISGGLVRLRFYHESNGVPSHTFSLDKLSVSRGIAFSASSMHDALGGRSNFADNHPLYGTNLTGHETHIGNLWTNASGQNTQIQTLITNARDYDDRWRYVGNVITANASLSKLNETHVDIVGALTAVAGGFNMFDIGPSGFIFNGVTLPLSDQWILFANNTGNLRIGTYGTGMIFCVNADAGYGTSACMSMANASVAGGGKMLIQPIVTGTWSLGRSSAQFWEFWGQYSVVNSSFHQGNKAYLIRDIERDEGLATQFIPWDEIRCGLRNESSAECWEKEADRLWNRTKKIIRTYDGGIVDNTGNSMSTMAADIKLIRTSSNVGHEERIAELEKQMELTQITVTVAGLGLGVLTFRRRGG